MLILYVFKYILQIDSFKTFKIILNDELLDFVNLIINKFH